MALISVFYGILIYLYKEGNRHGKPHVHAMYNEYKMSIAADGEILAGELPPKQQRIVEAWVSVHETDIIASWDALNKFNEVIKIKGWE